MLYFQSVYLQAKILQLNCNPACAEVIIAIIIIIMMMMMMMMIMIMIMILPRPGNTGLMSSGG